jgi:hypothetical protein
VGFRGLPDAEGLAGVEERHLDRPPGRVAGDQVGRGGGQVGGRQGQHRPLLPVADQDHPDWLGPEHPVPQAIEHSDPYGLHPSVAGDIHHLPPGVGGGLNGGADPVAFQPWPPPLAGGCGSPVVQHGVAGQPGGPGEVGGQVPQAFAVVGGVGNHVDASARHPSGDDRDHLVGQLDRRGGALCPAIVGTTPAGTTAET